MKTIIILINKKKEMKLCLHNLIINSQNTMKSRELAHVWFIIKNIIATNPNAY